MAEGALVFYLDEQVLLALANCLLDYLLLWATAAITRTQTRWERLAAGAGIGTVYYALYVLSVYGLLPYYGVLRQMPTVVAVSFLMIAAVFAPMPRGRFWSIVVHFYMVSFLSAGSGLAGAHLLSTPGSASLLAGVAVAVCSLLLVAELGWGVLQRRSWRQGLQIPVDILFGNCATRITALLDTGNRLRDPISGVPVIVVEHKALSRLFPPDLAHLLEHLEAGDLGQVTGLLDSEGWPSRFRIIPFTSIGASNGMMVGFRPDEVTLWQAGKPYRVRGCIIALSPRLLDSGRMYQALIGPDLLENATHGAASDVARGPVCHLREEERAHAVTHG